MINFMKGILGLRTTSSPICNKDRRTKWLTDIEFIETELPKRHKNLFYKLNKNVFYSDLSVIKDKIEELSDNEIKVYLMKIIASVLDGHTKLILNNDRKYPFEFFSFDDGVYLIKSLEIHSEYIGSKLTHINNQSIEKVINDIQECVSSDNYQQLKNRVVKYLIVPEILNGLKIIIDYKVSFTFQTKMGDKIDLIVEPCVYHGKDLIDRNGNNTMLHLSHLDENYWYTYIEKDGLLYFQYNLCQNNKGLSFRKFNIEMFKFIDIHDIKKLVIDIRHNGGGNSMVLNPFLRALKKRPHLNKKNIFYVIVGRETFSSALLNGIYFVKKTNATLVGEPTGGKPNHFGEIMYLKLSNSNLEVMYSTQYFKNINYEIDFLEPNIAISSNSFDYFNNLDKVLLEINK